MLLKTFPCERQLDMMDCGPACLKIIAKYYGKFYSLQYLRDKCGITKDGISFRDLSYAAENLGFRTLSLKCIMSDLVDKIPLPIIVHWDNSHFIVVYKTTKKFIYVSDPARGYGKYTIDEFSQKWIKPFEGKGVLLALEPQVDFYDKQPGERRVRRKTFNSVLSYFIPYKKSFINLLVVMLLVTILQGLLPFISKAVIDVGIQTKDLDFINLVLGANILIYISILLSNIVRDWILLHVTSRINISLISDYLIKLMRLPITFFETKMIGDILQRAQDHERIRSFIMNNALNMIFSSLTFLVFGVILLTYNTTIFWVFAGGSTLYIIWIMLFLTTRKKLDWEYFELVSKNESYWVETIGNIQEIKINNYETYKRWKWEDIQARLYKVNIRVMGITNLQSTGGQFIESIKNLTIIFFCAASVINGKMTFGTMISTQFIIGMLNAPIQQFIQFIISFQSAQISFLRLNEIHQLEDEHQNVGQDSIILPDTKSLKLQNIAFQYTPSGPFILKGLNLIIPEGKITAIVGDSGCGKSTLLKLLLRLYKPSFGTIQIGNMNVNNIGLKQWRDACGVVMQDGKIFNDTILNNIVLDDEKIDYKKLKMALSIANILTEVEKMPLGYQTVMGEQGRGLSGGQKQRILIARALYKDPEYLFFDEATNSLDTINEQKIVASLNEFFKKKTVIIVAHRLSTIQKANQIVVMQSGSVVEVGDHNTLYEKKGLYYELIQAQLNASVGIVN